MRVYVCVCVYICIYKYADSYKFIQDPDPDPDPGSDPELSEKSDPDPGSDPKKIIPDTTLLIIRTKAKQFAGGGKEYTLHVYTAMDTPCTSILQYYWSKYLLTVF